MNNWNKVLAMLDRTLGFEHRKSSRVMKRGQGFDNKKQEHVVWIEYRARTNNDGTPTPTAKQVEALKHRKMEFLCQLLEDIAGADQTTPGA